MRGVVVLVSRGEEGWAGAGETGEGWRFKKQGAGVPGGEGEGPV